MGFVIFAAIMVMLIVIGLPLWLICGKSHQLGLLGMIATFVCSVLLIVVTLINAYNQVEAGEVRVAKSFGTTVHETWGEGVHWIAPWYSFNDYPTRRQSIDFTDKETLSGASKGGVELSSFDVTFPYSLNEAVAWKIYQRIKNYGPLITNAARSAGRDALAQFNWEEITYLKRAEVTDFLRNRFEELLVADLMSSDFTEVEAKQAFNIYNPQIRKVVPPEAILKANADNAAADVELQRQDKLTAIAAKEAARRGNEGLGVQKLFEQLPQASADEIRMILDSISNKVRADALMKAVEGGQVEVIVLQGQEGAVNIKK